MRCTRQIWEAKPVILTKNSTGDDEGIEDDINDSGCSLRAFWFCIDLILVEIRVYSHSDKGKLSHYCVVLNSEKPVNRLWNGRSEWVVVVVEF